MDPITQQAALGAAGAGGGDPVYVDDVFQPRVYTGNGGSQTINLGLDLAGEGGLTINKTFGSGSWRWTDTERGNTKRLSSNSNAMENTDSGGTTFTSTGFSMGGGGDYNDSGTDFISYSFVKSPGFFDCVTWVGDGVNGRQIAHNLGSKPGMMIIKLYEDPSNSSNTASWIVYNQGATATQNLYLDSASGIQTGAWTFTNTEPTTTHFTIGSDGWLNATSRKYVAYLFAHNEPIYGTDGNQSIISCDVVYATTGTWKEVNLGYEPQFLLLKHNSNTDWEVYDSNRSVGHNNTDHVLRPNATGNAYYANKVEFTPTGFRYQIGQYGTYTNMYYMAIRRPNKPPTVGTEVFDAPAYVTSDTGNGIKTSNSIFTDLLINIGASSFGHNHYAYFFDRKMGGGYGMQAAATWMASNYGTFNPISATGYHETQFWVNANIHNLNFKRAPGFLDIVVYDGLSNNTVINHNLEVAPEMIIIRRFEGTGTQNWAVGNFNLNKDFILNQNQAGGTSMSYLYPSAPTATQFTINANSGNLNNNSGDAYVAYLMASCPGISKIGSYTGSSNAVNVDCGFTSAARFVLIKRVDSAGDWLIFSTTAGINASGSSEYGIRFAKETTPLNADYINPTTTGFQLSASNEPMINTTGGTYMYWAIA